MNWFESGSRIVNEGISELKSTNNNNEVRNKNLWKKKKRI